MKFSYRKYQAGDEEAINQLYYAVTGLVRTIEQHAWQWLQTPGGKSEMWLIEAELSDGTKKLIGHHGVMALEFSYFGEPVRVGKTENTMVLPEFREKILYPRYEKKFLSHYEKKFHALFSTVGPAPAIRLRKAMGYEAKYQWQKAFIGKEPLLSLLTIANVISRKLNSQEKLAVPVSLESSVINGANVQAYTDNKQPEFDFDAFWQGISSNYPLTPTRNTKNLTWRYWKNPYREHLTLIIDTDTLGTCVCILSFQKKFSAFVEDIFCEDIKDLPAFLEIIYSWLNNALRIYMLEFCTTSDSIKKASFYGGNIRQSTWVYEVAKHFRELGSANMPRKITSLGKQKNMKIDSEWFVTPFYFEGR